MKRNEDVILTDEGLPVKAVAPVILSISRSTDIPAFYADWFFRRLDKGYCKWRNPFNGVDSFVAFRDVRFIVFWSKNPAPLLPYLEILRGKGINCYVQYTLNDYEAEGFEPGVLPLEKRIETFRNLVGILGKGSVIWRFDPLLLTDKIGMEDLLSKVEGIGNRLKDFTEKLVFSFADIAPYRKVAANLNQSGVNYREWSPSEMKTFAERLSDLNKAHGWNFALATCAEKIDLSQYGISHNRCIDDELITRIAWRDQILMHRLGMKIGQTEESLFGDSALPNEAIDLGNGRYTVRTRANKDSGQRALCGCIAAKDIGRYNTCPHGCVYCYANTSHSSALRNHSNHNPNNDFI